MLRLYGSARSRALRTLWMLGELGLTYDHKDYLPRAPETRDAGVSRAQSQRPRADDRRRRLRAVGIDGDQLLSREEAQEPAVSVGPEERGARPAVEPVGDRPARPPDRELRPALPRSCRRPSARRRSPRPHGKECTESFDVLETALAKSEWLAGPAFSVGDLNVAAALYRALDDRSHEMAARAGLAQPLLGAPGGEAGARHAGRQIAGSLSGPQNRDRDPQSSYIDSYRNLVRNILATRFMVISRVGVYFSFK